MSFIALLFAVAWEQLRPLQSSVLERGVAKVARLWYKRFASDNQAVGRLSFTFLMLLLWLPVIILLGILQNFFEFFYFVAVVLIFYNLIVFRRHQKAFAAVRNPLLRGDLAAAKEAALQSGLVHLQHEADVAEATVRDSLATVQRDFFTIFFWGMLPFVGVPVAIFYWLNQKVVENWARQADSPAYRSAEACLRWLNWLPYRFSGFLLALMGNFEIAFFNLKQSRYRKDADLFQAMGIGALGILETPVAPSEYEGFDSNIPLPVHTEWDLATVRSVGGLLLRTTLGYGLLGSILFLIFI